MREGGKKEGREEGKKGRRNNTKREVMRRKKRWRNRGKGLQMYFSSSVSTSDYCVSTKCL